MAKELNKITNKSKTAKKSKKELSAKSRKKVSGGLKVGEARVKDMANRNAKTVLVDAASHALSGPRGTNKKTLLRWQLHDFMNNILLLCMKNFLI